MIKRQISNFLRALGLIYFIDHLRFYFQKFKNRGINRNFILTYPSVKLPPDYLMYESFQINYHKYYLESINAAKWLVGYFKKYVELKNKKILDWGCGPGRIIRHFPDVIDNGCEFYGTDYNKKSIEWCSENLKSIHFNNNTLQANLPYPEKNFDIIYGISIFTHLSEQLHYDWYSELFRVLKKGGIMLFTTHGDNYKEKLTGSELLKYNRDELVIRGKVKEGHRTYSAFHPKEFMRKLFKNVEILEHIETIPETGKWLPQDVWIVRK